MLKRSFDIILSLLLIIIFSPLFIFLILIYLLFFNGKPIYISKRVGKKLEEFKIYKFRSMIKNAENLGPEVSGLNDKRNLIIGRFIRLTKIDELPQLYNILIGDMSFVGPRPALYNQEDLIAMRTERGVEVLVPGITGWAQVNGRDELPIPEKVALDTYYLNNQSFWLDIRILWMTFLKVLKREGVSH